jgi:hypothetical protein
MSGSNETLQLFNMILLAPNNHQEAIKITVSSSVQHMKPSHPFAKKITSGI